MRSCAGDGYNLFVFRGRPEFIKIPSWSYGIFWPYIGEWEFNQQELISNYGYEFHTDGEQGYIEGKGGCAALLVSQEPESLPVGLQPQTPVFTGKPWGYELEVPTQLRKFQLKLLYVAQGAATSLQRHIYKDEVMISLMADSAARHIYPGEIHRMSDHRLYFEGSTYFPDDVIRLEDSYGRS